MTTRHMIVTVDGTAYDVTVELLDEGAAGQAPLRIPAVSPQVAMTAAPARPAPKPAASPAPAPAPAAGGGAGIVAPLAGTVVKVHVTVGQQVSAGQTVITLEAMKMNTDITANAAGTVSAVLVNEGASVGEGAVLVQL